MAGSLEQMAWVLGQEWPADLFVRLMTIANQGDSGTEALAAYGFVPYEPLIVPKARTKEPIPLALRTLVFERDTYRCQRCDGWESLTIDHIFPESLGGEATLDNLQTLCRSCNSRKGARV